MILKQTVLSRYIDKLSPQSGFYLLLLSVLIGATTGLAAVAFVKLIYWIQHLGFVALPEALPWLGNWIYLIVEGCAKVKRKTGKGMLTTDTLGEGDIFGALGLLGEDTGPRKASVVAEGPVTVGLLDSNRLIDDLNALSPHMRKFISTLVKRLDNATSRIVSMVGT